MDVVGDGKRAGLVQMHQAGGGVEGTAVEVEPDQACNILGRRIGGHLCWGALLDDPTVLDEQETVGLDHGLEGVVGDDQDGAVELVEVAA